MNSNEFEKTISDAVLRALEPLGYRRDGKCFRADRPEATLVIQCQRSVAGTHNRLRTTVNLGVFSRAVAEKLGILQAKPTFEICHWKRRIGELLPEPQDRWWSVGDHAEALHAAQEICGFLEKHGVPTLEQLASAAKLRELWQSGRAPGLTAKELETYLEAIG
jgi:hypothetical protein